MKFAKSRALRIAGSIAIRTPLVLPAFSSRALPASTLSDTISRTLDIVVGPVLISALDLYNGGLQDGRAPDWQRLFDLPLVFIDSGGYEVLSDKSSYSDQTGWSREKHTETLKAWPAKSRAVMVNLDAPLAIEGQIQEALSLLPERNDIGRELLLKPPPGSDLREVIPLLKSHASNLRRIDVIGVTEKEAGDSLEDRLHLIVSLRRLLDKLGIDIPIHIFGGLDPILAPLYFLAGADIFDGLTWLRYAYDNGEVTYLQAFAALRYPDMPIAEAEWVVRRQNYSEVAKLQIAMQRYLATGDLGALYIRPADHLSKLLDKLGISHAK